MHQNVIRLAYTASQSTEKKISVHRAKQEPSTSHRDNLTGKLHVHHAPEKQFT
jgi:hypothetical protein